MRLSTKSQPKEITLYSPLTPREIAQRMLSLIGEGEDAHAAEGFIGNGDESQMTLHRAKGRDNALFEATLHPHDNGTRIEGKFASLGMSKTQRRLFFGIFGGVGMIFLLIGIGGLIAGLPPLFSALFIGVPLFQWLIVAFILSLFKRGDKPQTPEDILAFLRRHLEIAD